MPERYEAMRDEFRDRFIGAGMKPPEALLKAEEKAAKIYNSTRKKGEPPVTRNG